MTQLTRIIQELSPHMLVCVDRVTASIVYHNPAFSKKIRCESDKILETSLFKFIEESSYIPLARVLKTIPPNSEMNLNVLLKNSKSQTIDVSLQVCRRSDNDFLLYLFFVDNTAQVKKDQDLEVYQQVIASSQEIMLLIDNDYNYRIANQAFLLHSGLKEELVIGRNIRDLLGDQADMLISMLDKTINTGETVRFQFELIDPVKQNVINLDSMYSPYRNDQGEITGVIVCARDITPYVETNKETSSSNHYYKSLFEYSPDLLASVNLQTGLILEANHTLEKVLGYESAELTGQHLFKFHGSAHKKVLAEAIVNLSNNNPINSLEVSLIAKDGSYISADLRTTPIVDADSNIAIFVWRDTRYQEKLAFKAAHDPLTHLYNRAGFMPLLEEAFPAGEERVLCFLDIDNFKLLNDTSGHLAGDEFLIAMADLLKKNMSRHDRLCRLGGDEFLVLVCGRELGEVHKLMRIVLLKMNSLIKGQRKYLNAKLGISIGVTPFSAGEESRTILTRADEACYQAKNNGKNQIAVINHKAAV